LLLILDLISNNLLIIIKFTQYQLKIILFLILLKKKKIETHDLFVIILKIFMNSFIQLLLMIIFIILSFQSAAKDYFKIFCFQEKVDLKDLLQRLTNYFHLFLFILNHFYLKSLNEIQQIKKTQTYP